MGLTEFMPLDEVSAPGRGYIVNDACIVKAEVDLQNVFDHRPSSYDSKRETGYVGLKNQGTTCYLNSALQMLYHIPFFRQVSCYTINYGLPCRRKSFITLCMFQAVYRIPTTENDMPSVSLPLALQSLFYKLQYSDNSVTTVEFTKVFNWGQPDSQMHQDVQELNSVLCERIEDCMKVHDFLGKLFSIMFAKQMFCFFRYTNICMDVLEIITLDFPTGIGNCC